MTDDFRVRQLTDDADTAWVYRHNDLKLNQKSIRGN